MYFTFCPLDEDYHAGATWGSKERGGVRVLMLRLCALPPFLLGDCTAGSITSAKVALLSLNRIRNQYTLLLIVSRVGTVATLLCLVAAILPNLGWPTKRGQSWCEIRDIEKGQTQLNWFFKIVREYFCASVHKLYFFIFYS